MESGKDKDQRAANKSDRYSDIKAYATSAEFCRVFAENMDNMHLLSFLLTAVSVEKVSSALRFSSGTFLGVFLVL